MSKDLIKNEAALTALLRLEVARDRLHSCNTGRTEDLRHNEPILWQPAIGAETQ